MIFNKNKSRPSPEEEDRIETYFAQPDTPKLKIHDRLARLEKIKKIQKMVNKLHPETYVFNEVGGMGGINLVKIIALDNGYVMNFESINSIGIHGIELLTLNQLEYLEIALKQAIPRWKQEYSEGINVDG